MVDTPVAAFGRLDAAFNNAGIQVPPRDAADEPAEVYRRVNAVNARGIWASIKRRPDQRQLPWHDRHSMVADMIAKGELDRESSPPRSGHPERQ